MESKCNLCALFGEKPHCHNCKIINKTVMRPAQEIDCSLEELVAYINENEDVSERLTVGDYKNIELATGEVVKLILLDTQKDKLADETGFARTTWGILTTDNGFFDMNEQNTNRGGFRDCKMRNVYLPRYFTMLPEILRQNIKPVLKKTSAGCGSSEIITTTDKLFLFSEVEMFGDPQYSYVGEGEQYEYFCTRNNRSFNRYTWLRSPYRGYHNCFVDTYGGSLDCNCASDHYALAPGFSI